MNRRRFLKLTAGSTPLFAGCSSKPGQQSETDTPTDSPTDVHTSTSTLTASPSDSATETEEPTATPREKPETIFVAPNGASKNPGTEPEPLASIQAAIDRATPGETIFVKPGDYTNPIETVRPGTPDSPITLTGPAEARLAAGRAEGGAMSRIRHSHFHINGMTFDGLINPDKPDQASSYQLDALIDVLPEFSSDEYLQNVRISPHGVGNGQGGLVNVARIKDSEIGPFRVIGPAGLEWKLTEKEGHVGEIVYLGTDPTNLGTDWHPWTENDKTRNLRVHHTDNSEGHAHSRLVQTKPGVQDITIEYCTDGGGTQIWREGTSSSVFFECHRATIRWSILKDGEGAGVSIGSPWATKDDATEAEQKSGNLNSVYGNRIFGFEEEALRFPHTQSQEDQRYVCNNDYDGKTDGNPAKSCPDSLPSGDGIGHLGGDSPWT